MPAYLFDQDGGDVIAVELADTDEARMVAGEIVGGRLRSSDADPWNGRPWRLTVADDKGLMLFLIDVLVTVGPAVGDVRRRPRR